MSQTGEMADGCLPDLSPDEKYGSKLDGVINELYIKGLADFIEKSNSDVFLDLVKKNLKFLQNQSSYDANKLSRMTSEVWQHPCFVDCVRLTIKEFPEIISHATKGLNNDSAADRAKHMVADPCFKHSLLMTIYDTTNTTLIRVFLSILFIYWTGEAELRELDERMGENHFGKRMNMMAKYNEVFERPLTEKDLEYDQITFIMKSINDLENMEPLRKELVNKYGEGSFDIQAILDKVERDLVLLMNIFQKYQGYDGGKARIRVLVCGGIAMVMGVKYSKDGDTFVNHE